MSSGTLLYYADWYTTTSYPIWEYGTAIWCGMPVYPAGFHPATTVEFTSRGGYPRFGDGPWFHAKAMLSPEGNRIKQWDGHPYLLSGKIKGLASSSVYLSIFVKDGVVWYVPFYRYKDWWDRDYWFRLQTVYTTSVQSNDAYTKCRIVTTYYSGRVPDFQGEPGFDFIWSIVTGLSVSETQYGSWAAISNLSHQEMYYDPVATQFSFEYKYNELEAFRDWDALGVMPNLYMSGFSAAYYNAAGALPRFGGNTIANLLETLQKVVSIARGDFGSLIPKTPKDIWLWYRYEYTTTKADITEYIDLAQRLADINTYGTVQCHGSYTRGEITYRCSLEVPVESFLPESFRDWLDVLNFKASLVNIWDMVPFSFVVDWFTHFGDLLEYFESVGNVVNVRVQNVWYSFTTHYNNQTVYCRVPGWKPTGLPPVDFVESGSKTWAMRAVDGISLFLV